MLIDGRFTISMSEHGCKISLFDNMSKTHFIDLDIPPEEFCLALRGLARQECKIEVRQLDKVGKTRKMKPLLIKVPKSVKFLDREEYIKSVVDQHADEGWEPYVYFGSQDSFIQGEDGHDYANLTQFKWV